MITWIKRGGRMFGGAVFFIVLSSMLVRQGSMRSEDLARAFLYASIAGSAFWFAGVVISDIVLKGILNDIDCAGTENLIEGGLLQRFQDMHEQLVPGRAEIPIGGARKKDEEKTGKRKKPQR